MPPKKERYILKTDPLFKPDVTGAGQATPGPL